jgi:hypothetical protein
MPETGHLGGLIQPGMSIGRLRLGMTRVEVEAILGSSSRVMGPRPEQVLMLEYPSVRVLLNFGVVANLIALNDLAGATTDGIAVGTSWRRLLAVRGEPVYEIDEAGAWIDALDPGMMYDIARPLKMGEQTLDPPYAGEYQVIVDPEHAFIRRIFIRHPK